MRFLLSLTFLLIALPVSAEEIYKCTNDKGHTAFQSTPCSLTQGKAEILEIDNEADPNYVPQAPSYHFPSSTSIKSGRNNNYERRRRETDKEICQIYKDALTNAEIKWDNVKRQGYKIWEEDLYTGSIRKAKQDVKRNCS